MTEALIAENSRGSSGISYSKCLHSFCGSEVKSIGAAEWLEGAQELLESRTRLQIGGTVREFLRAVLNVQAAVAHLHVFSRTVTLVRLVDTLLLTF